MPFRDDSHLWTPDLKEPVFVDRFPSGLSCQALEGGCASEEWGHKIFPWNHSLTQSCSSINARQSTALSR